MSSQVVNIIFDTNAYRTLTHGFTPTAAENAILQLRAKEGQAGVQALASPYVIRELLAHLADTNDPAYAHCLSATCALQRHCEEDPATGQIWVLSDAESQMTLTLYGVVPADHQQATQILTSTCFSVQRDPTETNLTQIRSRLVQVRDWVTMVETQFVDDMKNFVVQGFDPVAKDWTPLQQDQTKRRLTLKYLESKESLRYIAGAWVAKAMMQAGEDPKAEHDYEGKVDYVMNVFGTPICLYREIARRIVMSGCDVSKNSRPNWIWDMHIAFAAGSTGLTVGGHGLRLITNDQDIAKAALDAGADSMVLSLDAYQDALHRGTTI